MTRWHTDAPIRPIQRLHALRSSRAVKEFRTDHPAGRAVRVAHAYWMRKLRQRAVTQKTDGDQGD